ncbi:MAG: hypothetical protein AMXMBFR23_28460 [Chloroflexota bacterium]
MIARRVLLAALVVGGVALAQSGKPTQDAIGGADRWLTHISTDKPIYREGETVYIRATVLEASRRTPLPDGTWANPVIEVRGPKGETVATLMASAQDSVAGLGWPVPEGQAGGTYTIRVTWPANGWSPAERTFDVRAYRAPRLKTQIVFLKDGYGPGDEVRATLSAERPEGGAPVGAAVDVSARVDGAEVYRGSATIDGGGVATTTFRLPKAIERGEGTLAMTVRDGGVVETATKTLPILTQTVDLMLAPEGGDLVVGLPCRVYFEGRLPSGKPADMEGLVVDSTGREVSRFASDHDGRGRFSLTPAPGEAYTLQVTRPSGITRTWELPQAKSDGATIATDEDVTKGGVVRLTVGSTRREELMVTLAKREVEVGRATVTVGAGEVRPVSVPVRDADGVLIATVWDGNGAPLAERLVFRRPSRELSVSIVADTQRTSPGQPVELTVTTREGDKPVAAVIGLTVTDDSVLELIDKRDQAPRLPVMALLEPEVRELADAHVYLDPADPRAPVALDRLLGTQGWRRFAFVDPVAFAAKGDAERRVVAFVDPAIAQRLVETRSTTGRNGFAAPRDGRPKVAEMDADKKRKKPMDPPRRDVPAKPVAPKPAAGPRPAVIVARIAKPAADAPASQAAKVHAAGRAGGLLDMDDAIGIDQPNAQWAVVREYAHVARSGRQPGERTDFAETLYWAAAIKTDEAGVAKVRFDTSDSVTGFRVLADAFSAGGALGAGTALIESVEPFHAEPKLPLFATQGDLVRLPVALTNGTDAPLEGAAVTVTADGATVSQTAAITLDPRSGARRLVDMEITRPAGKMAVVVAATAGAHTDTSTRELVVEPNGFPQEVGFGGLLAPGKSVTRTVTITPGLVPGSLVTKLSVQPSPVASLTSAFERLIQEPYGCFEQTSSTTYPLVMAQQYFTTHEGVDAAIIERSAALLDKGHDRLRSFECKQQGYEWFGQDPAHEALTAYGLLEFTAMSKVRAVDADMLGRTRQWLLGQRDGKGGFKRERRALHTWVEDRAASNAYITWALVSTAGPKGLEDELLSVEDVAHGSEDSYVIALTANAMQLGGRADAAKLFLDKLAKAQGADGGVDGGVNSIVGSRGEALRIETTALAVLAWLRSPAHEAQVERAVAWLADVCKGGRYGSTQSTVLALQAIVAYDAARAAPRAPGTVRLLVDGKLIGAAPFDATTKGALELPDFSATLTPGAHTITVEMEGGSPMPLTGAVTWSDASPASSKECVVALETKLNDGEVREGAVTEVDVTVRNTSSEAVPTPIAIVGVPGGLEPRHDQLKELVKAGTIAAYEVRGRDVVLYWRDLGAGKSVRLPISLVAAIPGTFTGPASRAYLYYGDEHKAWTPGAKVTVVPKEG